MKLKISLFAVSALACFQPALAQDVSLQTAKYELLIDRAMGKTVRVLLSGTGKELVWGVQTSQIEQYPELKPVWDRDANDATIDSYFDAVATRVSADYVDNLTQLFPPADMEMLLEFSNNDKGLAALFCAMNTTPGADGALAFDTCAAETGAAFAPAVREKTSALVKAIGAAMGTRLVNDGLGGSICHSIDRLTEELSTEEFKITLTYSFNLGDAQSTSCSKMKMRWAALAGYDAVMKMDSLFPEPKDD